MAFAFAVLVCLAAVASAPAPTRAASSTTIGATVLGATSIAPGSCPGGVPGSTAFTPPVLVSNSFVTGDDCSVSFGSTNTSSSLLVHQTDQHGAVMFRHSHGPTDSSYGSSGRGVIPSGSGDEANSVAIQPDGKAVVVGQSATNDVRVARFLTDGAPDPDFGDDGVVTVDISAGVDVGRTVLIDRDGTLLVSGTENFTASRRHFVMRLDTQGELVDDFGAGGIALVDNPAGGDRHHDMKLMSDGRIVLGGDVCCYRFAAARLLPDGTPDQDFGSNGVVHHKFPNEGATTLDSDSAEAVDVDTAGAVVLVGNVRVNGTAWSLAVAKLDDEGQLDPGFSDDGLLRFPGISGRAAVILDDDGRITILAGGVMMRLLPDGSNDPSFNGGAMRTGLPAGGLSRDSLGRYVVAGGATVARILPDGGMDTSFNGTGSRNIGAPGTTLHAITEATDGRLMLAGSWSDAGVNRYVTTRLAATTISGYAPSSADFAPGNATFAACVRALEPHGTATFTSGWLPAGDCIEGNAPHWNAVPAQAQDASRIASIDGAGTGTAHLRFGLRTLPNQPAGTYLAPLTFVVVAPSGL